MYHPFFTATLFINGKICCFRRKSGELVALNCAQASEPDLYYVPSKVLIVNPRFKGESYNLTPGEDCEVIYCTSQDMYRYGVTTGGLYSLLDMTARLLTDNILSLNICQKNTRLTSALAADDENTKDSLELVLKEMYAGRPYKIVQKTLLDKLEQLPLQQDGSAQSMLQLLEAHKYILSEFYAAIGIDEPQQMKKERLVTAEVEQGAELPMFNIYDIFTSISEGVERVNKMFGTEIKVRINPLLVQALEGTEAEDAAENLDTEEGLPDQDMVMQPPEESADDTAPELEAEREPETEEETAAEGTPAAEPSEPEPETITDAALDIIEQAVEIIELEQEGGAENEPNETEDAGALREDRDEGTD
jgi:Phage Connector (GP10).